MTDVFICTQTSTFQLVLASDGQRHVMMFHYADINHRGEVNVLFNVLMTAERGRQSRKSHDVILPSSHPILSPFPFLPLPLFPPLPPLPSEVGPLKSARDVWGRCELPQRWQRGRGAQHQPKSN